jgi:aspartate aminotransferase
LTDPGDEVIICSPYWLSYPDMAISVRAIPVFVDCIMNENFAPTPDQIRSVITSRADPRRTPSNTGGHHPRPVQGHHQALRDSIVVVSDKIYKHLVTTARTSRRPRR